MAEKEPIQVRRIKNLVSEELTGYNVSVDEPADPSGEWFIDLFPSEEGREQIVVQWRKKQGFGISKITPGGPPEQGLFEGPDRVFKNFLAAKRHLIELTTVS